MVREIKYQAIIELDPKQYPEGTDVNQLRVKLDDDLQDWAADRYGLVLKTVLSTTE